MQEMCRATCGRCAALEDCPESCECRDNVRGCIRLASCGADYVRGGPEPVASELRFHANTDCVALGDGRLAKLDQLQVAELLAALPARLRSLDLAMSGLGSGGGGGDGGIAPGGFASRAFARFSSCASSTSSSRSSAASCGPTRSTASASCGRCGSRATTFGRRRRCTRPPKE